MHENTERHLDAIDAAFFTGLPSEEDLQTFERFIRRWLRQIPAIRAINALDEEGGPDAPVIDLPVAAPHVHELLRAILEAQQQDERVLAIVSIMTPEDSASISLEPRVRAMVTLLDEWESK